MTNNFKPSGLVLISGDPDSGKTSAGLFANYPYGLALDQIAYIHDDDKEPPYTASDYGFFLSLDSRKMKLFEYGKAIDAAIASLDPKKIKGVVFDTWPKYGESIIHFVVSHGGQFRERDAFIMRHNSTVIGAQTWRDAYTREGKVASDIAKKFGLLIAISHTKQDNKSGVKSDKMIEVASKQWKKSANARLWLVNDGSGVPSVLVKKRFGKSWIKDGRPQTVNFLPQRLTPQDEDRSIWDMINRYWNEPVDGRPLTEFEKPLNDEEVAIIRDTWTQRQYEMWLKETEMKRISEVEKLAEEDAAIMEFVQTSSSPVLIVQAEVKKKWGRELKLKEIGEMRK